MSKRQRPVGPAGPAHPLVSANAIDGLVRIAPQALSSLDEAWRQDPTCLTALGILEAALLSGGIHLSRNGQRVALKSTFASHLADVWVPFARDLLASVLKYGLAVAAIVDVDTDAFGQESTKNDIPVVPMPSRYSLLVERAGRHGLGRRVRAEPVDGPDEQDTAQLAVFVHRAPSEHGKLASPLASVYEELLFAKRLRELALQAEVARARVNIVTQVDKRQDRQNDLLDPQNLFFDRERYVARPFPCVLPLRVSRAPLFPTAVGRFSKATNARTTRASRTTWDSRRGWPRSSIVPGSWCRASRTPLVPTGRWRGPCPFRRPSRRRSLRRLRARASSRGCARRRLGG